MVICPAPDTAGLGLTPTYQNPFTTNAGTTWAQVVLGVAYVKDATTLTT